MGGIRALPGMSLRLCFGNRPHCCWRNMGKRHRGCAWGGHGSAWNKKEFVSCSWGRHSPSVLPHTLGHFEAPPRVAQPAQTVPRADCASCCAQARVLANVTRPGTFCTWGDERLSGIPFFLPLLPPPVRHFNQILYRVECFPCWVLQEMSGIHGPFPAPNPSAVPPWTGQDVLVAQQGEESPGQAERGWAVCPAQCSPGRIFGIPLGFWLPVKHSKDHPISSSLSSAHGLREQQPGAVEGTCCSLAA